MKHNRYDLGLSPCGPQKKEFWWIPAAVGAVSGLVDLFTGNDSSSLQDKQNAMNYEIAHEANQYNLEMSNHTNSVNYRMAERYNQNQLALQKQAQAYNEEMWNKANDYNSPSANIQRYLQAGVNPNFAFGQISNVQPLTTDVPQQTSSTATSAPPAVVPEQKVSSKTAFMKPLIESIVNMPQYKEQMKSLSLSNTEKEEDVRRKRIENDIKERSNKAYDNMSFIVNPNDETDVITPSMYEDLSEEEQKHYREISTSPDGKPIRVDGKQVYSTLPNIQKMSFGSREVYDDFMHRMRTSSEFRKLRTSSFKDVLDSKVFREQINNPKVISALSKMPVSQLESIVIAAKKANQDYKESISTFQTRKEIQDQQLESLRYDLESKKNHDIFNYLDKILNGDSDWKDFAKAAFYLMAAKAKVM